LKCIGVYSDAIVTNGHAQQVAQIMNFNFNACRFGMTHGVHNCFTKPHPIAPTNTRSPAWWAGWRDSTTTPAPV
jgi:hypothetical protein